MEPPPKLILLNLSVLKCVNKIVQVLIDYFIIYYQFQCDSADTAVLEGVQSH